MSSSLPAPLHQLDPDAAFAADISARMRVPKRIQLAAGPGGDDFHPEQNGTAHHIAAMSVPDRIVLGAGSSPGPPVANHTPPRRAQTPPTALRLDQYPYPPAEDPPTSTSSDLSLCSPELRPAPADRSLTTRDPALGSLTPAEEVELLRRQLYKVNRRLLQLETAAQRQRSREVVLYSAGIAYFVIKALLWLGRPR